MLMSGEEAQTCEHNMQTSYYPLDTQMGLKQQRWAVHIFLIQMEDFSTTTWKQWDLIQKTCIPLSLNDLVKETVEL